MEQNLEKLRNDTLTNIANTSNIADLIDIEVAVLGRKGELTAILRGLKDLEPNQRGSIGSLSNKIKQELEDNIATKKQELEKKDLEHKLSTEYIDTTLPSKQPRIGHLHPIFAVQYEIEDIFTSMGFSVVDGPELETEWYNFDALNIPKNHPARDMWDTFFTTDGYVLRTHTSPVQIRAMQEYGTPLRIIAPGRCYRNEALDANHEHTLNQIEGLVIDKDISIANMKDIFEKFLSKIFKNDVKVRLRPGYFPFVTPGMEVDFTCTICRGKGCKTCKHSGWLEFMGCGMVHPKVLKAVGVDPDIYQGFAFGFGLDRLTMMKHKIADIRSFTTGDIRFLSQF